MVLVLTKLNTKFYKIDMEKAKDIEKCSIASKYLFDLMFLTS